MTPIGNQTLIRAIKRDGAAHDTTNPIAIGRFTTRDLDAMQQAQAKRDRRAGRARGLLPVAALMAALAERGK